MIVHDSISTIKTIRKLEHLSIACFAFSLIASIFGVIAICPFFVKMNADVRILNFFLWYAIDVPFLIISNILSFIVFYRLCAMGKEKLEPDVSAIAILAIFLSIAPTLAGAFVFRQLIIIPIAVVVIYLTVGLILYACSATHRK